MPVADGWHQLYAENKVSTDEYLKLQEENINGLVIDRCSPMDIRIFEQILRMESALLSK